MAPILNTCERSSICS